MSERGRAQTLTQPAMHHTSHASRSSLFFAQAAIHSLTYIHSSHPRVRCGAWMETDRPREQKLKHRVQKQSKERGAYERDWAALAAV
mmetsp:Transcript_31119/g.77110  ORF Transcript_31119/g.77110 Transcript_31119/m.77110 type:complete len:87 (-) Transcript_31119:418-678(-)